jgi:hypothetical protein
VQKVECSSRKIVVSRLTLRRASLRLTTGAFILSTGLDKWKGDEQTPAQIHGIAVGTYPFHSSIEPRRFLRTPGMRRSSKDLRSTPQGLTISKDVWIPGAGLSLVIDGVMPEG